MTAARVALDVGRFVPAVARTARPQVLVAGGQAAAGVGNLAFALVAARLLAPSAYADLVTFLALYLLLHLPAMSISAASALAPGRVRRARLACAGAGLALGGAIAAASGAIAGLLHLPTSMALLVAAAAPGACLLGLERGRLYGTYRHGAIVTTLLAEPITRLSLGVLLAVSFGPAGAAVAVVAGGYIALLAASRGPVADGAVVAPPERRRVAAAAAAFLLLAVLQNQDLLLAKALLTDGQASRFAVISALGGAAAFATATIPLVLLPDASRRTRHAVATAVGVAAALGGGVLAVGVVAPERLIITLFGEPYRDVAGLVVPYLAAMALFGVTRVLVAARCSTTAGRGTVAAVAVVTGSHAAAVVVLARTPADVVQLTLAATATLAATLVAPVVVRFPIVDRARVAGLSVHVRSVLVLMAVALAVRLLVLRGIWIDEAISIRQAQLPWQEMLTELRVADVHPPLYQALLWCVVRVFGTGVVAVKLLSIVAGVALVPALYATGAALYDRRTGMVAATFGTVAPFLVWYSQESRMYALFILFAVLAVYGQVQAVRRGRLVDWGIYAVSTAGLLWTQYFAVLPVLVQQAAFLGVVWHRRGQPAERRRVLLGWVGSVLVIAASLAPLLPFVSGQVEAYGNRSGNRFGELPTQAGGDVSGADRLSAYAAIANGIWAVWGYHADRVMAQVGALWPAGMLLALLALGRRRSRATTLLVALVVVPGAALFVLGLEKRDLFELRYFSGAVPMLLLVIARGVTVAAPSRVGAGLLAGLATATLGVGLVDQQLNGANPRRYDFSGALARVEAMATDDDILLYEPNYLSAVVEYYSPGLDSRPLGRGTGGTDGARRVFVLATDRVADSKASAAKVGDVLAALDQGRDPITDFRRPNVRVWVLQ